MGVTEDKAIYIRLALIVVSLLVLGNAAQAKSVLKEPAHFDNVVIEAPKELEPNELLHPRQEKSQIKLAVANVPARVQPPTGSHTDWMQQAGISPNDYSYVEFIISHESSWRHTAVNPSSGATGLCQALPAHKMQSAGSDYMANPVTQLRWCDSYAKQRYGGWAQAYSFWQAKRWW